MAVNGLAFAYAECRLGSLVQVRQSGPSPLFVLHPLRAARSRVVLFLYNMCACTAPFLPSPSSPTPTIQSVWALMQLGQLLTATLALSSVSAATGFFISASTMMVVALVFAVLSRWFVYAKDPTAAAASLADEEPLLPAHSQQQGVGASSTK